MERAQELTLPAAREVFAQLKRTAGHPPRPGDGRLGDSLSPWGGPTRDGIPAAGVQGNAQPQGYMVLARVVVADGNDVLLEEDLRIISGCDQRRASLQP